MTRLQLNVDGLVDLTTRAHAKPALITNICLRSHPVISLYRQKIGYKMVEHSHCNPPFFILQETPLEQSVENRLAHWQRRFFTVWSGQAVSLLGSNLVQFALIWWLTKSTGSATILALATLAGLIPNILIGPFAGALVDRWNRRMVMIVADSAIALFSLLLAALFLTGRAQVWTVFVIMAIRSVGGAFHWPAMQASTSLMVPHKQLTRIAGMNQMLFGMMNIVAPPLGAYLMEIIPVGAILMIDVATAAVAVFTLIMINIPQPEKALEPASGGGLNTMLQDMRSAFHYISGWSGFMALIGIAMVINFLATPAFSLVPILVTKHFEGQAMQLGIMNSAWGFGVVIGGVILSAWGGFRKKIYTSFAGLIGMGIGIALLGLLPPPAFLFGVAAIGLAGIMNPIANGPLFAIFQTSIAPEMQGRVFALIGSLSGLISPISLLVAGPIADSLGVQVWYVAGGGMCILMAIVGLLIPAILQIEEHAQGANQDQVVNAMVK